MLLSKKVIANFIPTITKIEDKKIVEALNAIGAEVESIKTFSMIDYLIIGKIFTIKKHPHAEKLNICSIQISDNKFINIISDSPNLFDQTKVLNKYVIVAMEGAELPNGITVINRDIRGMNSSGLLCSYADLNPQSSEYLSEYDSKNIIILDKANLGDTEVYKYLNIDDTIFDISIPSSRPDWHGIRFLAKELAAYLNLKYVELIGRAKQTDFHQINFKVLDETDNKAKYFGGIHLRNYQLQQSSWNTKGILINNHIKPINDLVDLSNLIPLFVANPIHIHDADKIVGDVRLVQATKKEQFLALDNKWYTVQENDLLVVDDEKIIALAGIIGSMATAVDENSINYFIEVGNFDRHQIIKSAAFHKINTYSANLFSKEISLYQTKKTFEYLYQYLLTKVYNQQLSELSKTFSVDEYHQQVKVNYDKIRSLLGSMNYLPDAMIQKSLTDLGFLVEDDLVYVPSYRNDIYNWQDLVEELLKILNINLFQPIPIKADYLLEVNNETNELLDRLSKKLRSLKFNHIRTYNLTSKKRAELLNLFKYQDPVVVSKPISETRQYYRQNILTNLLEVYQLNRSYKNKLYPIFEIQSLLTKNGANHHIGLVMANNLFNHSYDPSSGIKLDLITIKGISDIIVQNFGFNCNYQTINDDTYLVKNDSLKLVVYDETIGYIGKIKKSILKEFDLADQDIYCLDINLERLITSINRYVRTYEAYDHYQEVTRDITFQLKNEVDFNSFINVINSFNKLSKWEIISIFDATNQIDTNKTYQPTKYTVRCYLKQGDKTYTTKEINQIFDELIDLMKTKQILI
ncbi:Phenylalanyl-tRNA synthetase beta chain [Mycoplasmoides gallisepticum str. R(low)]|uniref:Phenylalanine--tRNA ligase beta subunit n=2 Tax=Mycoplasmoides gallisepticum TaxID=2096 RepID=SYFB_MYCGA|nr:phenylalanine--tRNA ligase subunit beta [Mycoplasmoides gallisepticum]Q7NBB7.2 RecName: Full=Phenylalanine--tRNA ligase beta subunit; AltName: Full=Phenylalanyl-tRNA synthetase beta subunit; Short=PheRS [Mycoplasmoides gallisepticum str. R(low)]AAP56712.2 Phenylalanyl-tRNA synthetase beta chain [Mycoplasmoides gallisepticum str. R(low)]ADC30565.1 Phenylalanyl-tRNA synthetase beta chain [Mycoplasmoides gallisepticum str. R(high)]